MRLPALALAVVAAAAPASHASPSATRIELQPLPRVSAGKVAGTRALIAVSRAGGRVRVYACDGTLRRKPTISAWFEHRWDGRSALKLRRGGHTLELDGRRGGRLDGHPFRLARAGMPAGLFDGRGEGTRATWIVLPGGEKRGTFAPLRPKKCRVVLTTQGWVTVCS